MGLPAPRLSEARCPVRLADRPSVAIRRTAADPLPSCGVRPEPATDDLAQLLAVVVGQDPLERFHQVAGDAALVRAGLVRVDHTHPGAAKGVLVEARLLRVEPAEAAHVVAQDRGGLAALGLRADVKECQELAASPGVETARVVGELADDPVFVGRAPGTHTG